MIWHAAARECMHPLHCQNLSERIRLSTFILAIALLNEKTLSTQPSRADKFVFWCLSHSLALIQQPVCSYPLITRAAESWVRIQDTHLTSWTRCTITEHQHLTRFFCLLCRACSLAAASSANKISMNSQLGYQLLRVPLCIPLRLHLCC